MVTIQTACVKRRFKGYTLIELMIVLAIIALLLTIAAPRYFASVERARESALRENLFQLRTSIDKFYTDKARYPNTLAELVDQRYLRKIPPDPITERFDSWTVITAKDATDGGVTDVKSGAPGKSIDGSAYGSW